MDFTIEQLIEHANGLQDHIDAETAKHIEALKPFVDGVSAIKAELLDRLNKQGVQNFKTEQGTAYKSTIMSVKVVDRGAFLEHVIAAAAWDMLPSTAVKDAVKEHLDANNGVPPPGVATDNFVKCNIRRS